jgi:hypothetical protein
VTGGVAMRKYALQDESDSLKAPMWVRTERQPIVAGSKGLRTMVIEKQKRAKAIQAGSGERPAGRQIAYVVTVSRMKPYDAP